MPLLPIGYNLATQIRLWLLRQIHRRNCGGSAAAKTFNTFIIDINFDNVMYSPAFFCEYKLEWIECEIHFIIRWFKLLLYLNLNYLGFAHVDLLNIGKKLIIYFLFNKLKHNLL